MEARVRCVGDPVALIAAETKRSPRTLSRKSGSAYRPLPVMTTVREALAEGAPKIHEKGNLLLHSKTRKGDIERDLPGPT